MKNLFPTKEIYKVKSKPINPDELGEPHSADEFFKRGMAYYARQKYDEAVEDFHHSLSLDKAAIDPYYGLGMVYKALSKNEKAKQAFLEVISLISAHADVNSTKYHMLRRLALGHINMIEHGDWNLEKEIWKRIA